jgi:hypothetical protein
MFEELPEEPSDRCYRCTTNDMLVMYQARACSFDRRLQRDEECQNRRQDTLINYVLNPEEGSMTAL